MQEPIANYYRRVIVDGVELHIPWDNILPGTSFFVPCINDKEVTRQVKFIFNKRGWEMRYDPRIENSMLGLRIWRIK